MFTPSRWVSLEPQHMQWLVRSIMNTDRYDGVLDSRYQLKYGEKAIQY